MGKRAKGKKNVMPYFLNTIVFCLKVSSPLVRVLRLVDGENRLLCGHEKGEGKNCQKL